MDNTTKFGVYLPQGFGQELAGFSDPVAAYETLTSVARTADEHGYETVWLADHFITVPPSQEMIFEAWTTAAALARDTRRTRIGLMVTGNNYRNPALQAKMASTLDTIAHGRFTFGIGAGWYEPDYRAYGYEFPEGPERLRQLREAVQIVRAMWTEQEATFEGEYYQVRGAINQPKGVQQRIPVLIAGGGEKVTLKLVAEFADAYNVIESPAGLERKFAVLRKHCDTVGRDYDSIHRTTATLCIVADTDDEARAQVPPGSSAVFPGDLAEYGLIGTLKTIRERIARYVEAGVQELAITFAGATELDVIRRFADEFIG